MLAYPTPFSQCFPLSCFPWIIPLSCHEFSNFPLLITWPTNGLEVLILSMVILLCLILETLFYLITLPSKKICSILLRNHTCVAISSVCRCFEIKLPKPRMHTSRWAQYSTPEQKHQDRLGNSVSLKRIRIERSRSCNLTSGSIFSIRPNYNNNRKMPLNEELIVNQITAAAAAMAAAAAAAATKA